MRSATPILLAVSMFASACSTGVTPPEFTAMAEVTTSLTYAFGDDFESDGFCVDPLTAANQEPSCSEVNGVSLPKVWPQVTVELEPFAIDVHEVTNLQYEYCVGAGACSSPNAGNAVSNDQQVYFGVDRFDQYPVVNVTWEQARDYCQFVAEETGEAVRLPTEAEWERVAKGPDLNNPRLFPTDNITSSITECVQAGFNGQYCRGDQRMDAVTDTTVDYLQEGTTRIYMMFGNAAEWVSTTFQEDVTCAGVAPCTPEDECSTGDAQCITDAKSCPACTAGTNCFYLCEGEPKKTILCEAYEASDVQSGADFEASAEGVNKVYRGGHVAIFGGSKSYALCQYRSSRANAKPLPFRTPIESQPWLGFRCAKSL